MLRPKLSSPVLLVLLVATIPGCIPAASPPASPTSRSDVLAGHELQSFRNVYEAVQALRNNWLQGRPALSCRCEPAVYVNGTRLRSIGGLREIPSGSARQVRHLSARDATQRFGGGHEGGAIMVEFTMR